MFTPKNWNRRIARLAHHCTASQSYPRIPNLCAKRANFTSASAQRKQPQPPMTIFSKILAGEIPSDKVYEDEKAYAFKDINPTAPIHFLVIPKQKDIPQLRMAKEEHKEVLGHLMYVAGQLGKEHCPDGFRVVVNDGPDGQQTVYHLHLHVIGGRKMKWPPG